jgi:hypothetical protein
MINTINAIFADIFDAERVSLIKWKSISICLIPAMTWYSKINILNRTNVLKKIEVLYASMNEIKAAGLSESILRIYAKTGRTIKKITIPETLCDIDIRADKGSWILNKLI